MSAELDDSLCDPDCHQGSHTETCQAYAAAYETADPTPVPRRKWEVNRRNGYAAVDEYFDGKAVRDVAIGLTHARARELKNACEDAYYRGQNDPRKTD